MQTNRNIQRLATGIDFDRADASIEIVFAAAAACQEILRSYRGFYRGFCLRCCRGVPGNTRFYMGVYMRFLYHYHYAFL